MNLRDLRRSRNLSMDAAAMLANVDPSTISRIESGKQRASNETVVRLSVALGIGARRMRTICDACLPERPVAS